MTLYQLFSQHGVTAASVAQALGVNKATVSKWNGRGKIPAERAIEIERATGISREKLRPDLFGGAS